MNIFDIQSEYMELMAFLEENEGELTPELEELLQFNKEAFENKTKNYISIIRKMESDVKIANEEIQRIQSFINKKESSISMLKNNLLGALKLYGNKDATKDIYRYEVGTYKISTRSSESVEVNELLIDDKWKEFTIEKLSDEDRKKIKNLLKKELKIKESVPKKPLKEALDGGQKIDGAEIKTSTSLTIK